MPEAIAGSPLRGATFSYEQVVLVSGGGRLTHNLIERLFLPAFANATLERLEDQAIVQLDGHGSDSARANRLPPPMHSWCGPLFFPGKATSADWRV